MCTKKKKKKTTAFTSARLSIVQLQNQVRGLKQTDKWLIFYETTPAIGNQRTLT